MWFPKHPTMEFRRKPCHSYLIELTFDYLCNSLDTHPKTVKQIFDITIVLVSCSGIGMTLELVVKL